MGRTYAMKMHYLSLLALLSMALTPAIAQIPETGAHFEAHVPIRAITSGKAHWFGYYDKEAFDPSGRYVLAMEVDFEDRSPTEDDRIVLGMVDTQDGDRWIPFAESNAWGWQQGCMLQWIPGSDSKVIYNTREGNKHIAIVQDVFTGEKTKLPRAIYTLSPNGKEALSPNFARIQDTRPGYGYKGGVDPGSDELAPDGDGIWRMNLETGEANLLFSYADIAAIPQEQMAPAKHWFNHLLYNTDGSRFIFLHRVHKSMEQNKGWTTRMFTANADGSDLYVVADHGMVSHFIWRDPRHILAWSTEPETGNKFHLYTDQTEKVEVVAEEAFTRDGHCTYSPDRKWILNDTYPDKNRMQRLYMFNVDDGRLVELGKFYRPKPSANEWRCDLHPRWNRSGSHIAIDSMHTDDSRQVYLLDVSEYTMAK
jgi:hypothetical protein